MDSRERANGRPRARACSVARPSRCFCEREPAHVAGRGMRQSRVPSCLLPVNIALCCLTAMSAGEPERAAAGASRARADAHAHCARLAARHADRRRRDCAGYRPQCASVSAGPRVAACRTFVLTRACAQRRRRRGAHATQHACRSNPSRV